MHASCIHTNQLHYFCLSPPGSFAFFQEALLYMQCVIHMYEIIFSYLLIYIYITYNIFICIYAPFQNHTYMHKIFVYTHMYAHVPAMTHSASQISSSTARRWRAPRTELWWPSVRSFCGMPHTGQLGWSPWAGVGLKHQLRFTYVFMLVNVSAWLCM